jgi:D-alanine-D-alanine ligase
LRVGIAFTVRTAEQTAGGGGLAGDEQEEFDSPETIQALAGALEGLGHEVELLGDGEPLVRRLLDGPRPELVFNIAEGRGGGRAREARVPAMLELLDIPYTGSDPLTLAATLDKDCAKRLVAASGIATPAWALFSGDFDALEEDLVRLVFPVFVKPAFEGSSKGILASSLIEDRDHLHGALEQLNGVYRQPVLIEEFIDGDELTVGIVGNQPAKSFGIMRVLPRHKVAGPFVYSLEIKRDWERLVRYECPAQLSPSDTRSVDEAALACWRALGCRDVSRFDFRLRDGVPYFLEVNPLPGLSPTSSDLVFMARELGVDHSQLVGRILQAAVERLGLDDAAGYSQAIEQEHRAGANRAG